MQRFGTAPMPTHAVGLALLRGEWALAAELLLAERDGEQQDMILARILWKEGKAAEAARNMPRRAVAERAGMLQPFSFAIRPETAQSLMRGLAPISHSPRSVQPREQERPPRRHLDRACKAS
jgi:tRNA(Glu) U13 pseudouridine synthase TruD